MTVALRAALLFALGLAVGLAWVEFGRGSRPLGPAPESAETVQPAVTGGLGRPPALDGPLPGPNWGRIVVRASTGRPLPVEPEGPPAGELDDGSVAPLWSPDDAAAPLAGPDEDPRAPAPWLAPDEPDPAAPADAVVELVVPDGSSLSMVVWRHYGTAPEPLVRAVARYNGLDDPNLVRAGQALRLPPRALLDER